MALRALDQTSCQSTELSASVCIVGGGIAGLIAAARLARDKQRRIIVVESGLKNGDLALAALNEIDNPVVPVKPSKVSIPTGRTSRAHVGE